MPREVAPPYLDAWKALLRAHAAALARIEALLAEAGSVPLTSYDVLLELSLAPGRRLRMADLAERVLLSRSGLTRLVERLEHDGYLERRPSAEDRRGTDAILTDAGRKALRRAWPTYAEGIRTAFADLVSEDEARVLARALSRVASGGSETDAA